MKRVLPIIIIIVLVLSFVGYKNNQNNVGDIGSSNNSNNSANNNADNNNSSSTNNSNNNQNNKYNPLTIEYNRHAQALQFLKNSYDMELQSLEVKISGYKSSCIYSRSECTSKISSFIILIKEGDKSS